MTTIKTTLHNYYFDIRTEQGAADYKALVKTLRAAGLKCFCSHGGGSHYLGGKMEKVQAVELETECLFANQWNTAPIPGVSEKGYRVFDWAEDYESNIGAPKGIKRGHYLEQTAEMKEIRRNIHKCGYCGKQEPAAKGYVFCPHCIGSEYLTSAQLHLTRMVSIEQDGVNAARAELTEAERAHLLPLYKDAQINGNTERDKKRIADKRAALVNSRDKAIRVANTEHDGFMWFLDRGINTDNLIYYSHTNTFCWGWRNPIDDCLKDEILEIISEFPFNYSLKCADGKTLDGKR